MASFARFFGATVGVITLLLAFLVVEVVVAMVLYMYMALNHPETFGNLVAFSRDVLNVFANQLEQTSPELANKAYTTLLGELGPKSILLLLIGLVVSAAGRFVGWVVRRLFLRFTAPRTAAGTA